MQQATQVQKYRQTRHTIYQSLLYQHDNLPKLQIMDIINYQTISTNSLISTEKFQSNSFVIHNVVDQKENKLKLGQPRNIKYPHICIGLIIANSPQNDGIQIYGTGTLIQNKMVLTSAQNVYSRRLDQEYTDIKFIPYLDNNTYSWIYDVRKVFYPEQYATDQTGFQQSNFAILELYNDLSKFFGFVGLDFKFKIQDLQDQPIYLYGYEKDDKTKQLKLREIKQEKFYESNLASMDLKESGIPLFIKEKDNEYYLIGIYNYYQDYQQILYLNQIKNTIDKWTVIYFKNRNFLNKMCEIFSKQYQSFKNLNYIELCGRSISDNECRHFQNKWNQLITLDLSYNKLGAPACRYLQSMECPSLNSINLSHNLIPDQGCESISILNWNYLQNILLNNNKIQAKGCEFLTDGKWIHLKNLQLQSNNIGNQGCKYLRKGNWPVLTNICLQDNNIGDQGFKQLCKCKWPYLLSVFLSYNTITLQSIYHLKFVKWRNLKQIQLSNNKILHGGYKELSQAKWQKILKLHLSQTNMRSEGCKYLKNIKLESLKMLNLKNNNIKDEGCRYLIEAKWENLQDINLQYNNITRMGLDYLKNGNWPQLTHLKIEKNPAQYQLKIMLPQQWQQQQQQQLQSRRDVDWLYEYECDSSYYQSYLGYQQQYYQQQQEAQEEYRNGRSHWQYRWRY